MADLSHQPALWLSSSPITTLSLPSLVSATGLWIYESEHLTTLEAPALERTDVTLYLNQNQRLTSLELPSLTVAGSIDIGENSALRELHFPALHSLTSEHTSPYLSVYLNPALESLDLSALSALSGPTHFGEAVWNGFNYVGYDLYSSVLVSAPNGACDQLTAADLPASCVNGVITAPSP